MVLEEEHFQMGGFKRILAAVDFGESSADALEIAVDLACQFEASLTLVHSVELIIPSYPGVELAVVDLVTPVEDAARAQLEAALRRVRERVPNAQGILRRGAAAYAVLDAITELRPDLVVTGTHGRHGVRRALLGSVAEKIVRLSPVPVLTVRRRSPARDDHAP